MKKPLFNRVAIVGVGLIGGSLGLAIKKRKLARLVVGVVHHKKTVVEAFRMRAVDVATLDLKEGLKGADLVILCGPISVIIKHLKTLSRFLGKNTIVIDVGSSKEAIDRAAKKHLTRNIFIGCHPMAGSEKCGIQHAGAGLFNGATCFLTSKNRKIERFWKELGSRPLLMDGRRHDDWAARVSHLPHLVAFAMFQNLDRPLRQPFDLNPSFKEIARLAKSHPKIWTDILSSNSRAILETLGDFKNQVSLFEQFLKKNNGAALARHISKANRHAKTVI